MRIGSSTNRRVAERRKIEANASRTPPRSDCSSDFAHLSSLPPERKVQRRNTDRRIAERRQINLGPSPETGERRFRPDLRGEIFPLYFNQKSQ